MLAWLSAALMQLTACWMLPLLTRAVQLASLLHTAAAASTARSLYLQTKNKDGVCYL